MRPARNPVRKANAQVAMSIDRARRCGFDPLYQAGVRAVAEEIAASVCVPSEIASFLLVCGLDHNSTND